MTQQEIPKVYNPQEAEQKWYPLWESRGYFKPEVNPNGQPYCIVIPPPNVTGYLHMGHALQHTLMDVLTRWRRMQGYKALWLPGTDHAGIATQVVVERLLAEEGQTREALGREAFEARVWQWKEHSGGTIQRQTRLEGASVDWSRERFTLDEGLSRAVREAFVRLYEEGLIYRGSYIVNWCPRCMTALSDLEAPKQETQGKLYYIAYKLVAGDRRGADEQPSAVNDALVVATTRPETMLGDTAVAVNPTDERYQHLRGATVMLPILNRALPVIQSDRVEKDFGTGVVKVTPAHDPADYEIGRQFQLPSIVVIGKDGRMTDEAGPYAGLDRFEARQRLLKDLEAAGQLIKVEDYTHSVGQCDRCHTVIEPLVSTQWFLNVKAMADEAIRAVKDGRTRFVPPNWEKTFFDWLENIRDWCISRQLWWGHRIPAWYCSNGHTTVARDAPTRCATCGSDALTQDEDVLDTWFSSALWPFSTLGWPDDTDDLRTFYPTSVLVTGFDIIFFWVARMMMMGLKFMNDVPFRTVFITGLIRDPYGQKMSKMKGNVIDPLHVFNQYGTDAVRFTLASAASPGMDIALQYSKMESYRNFCNKIWNAARFVMIHCAELEPTAEPPTEEPLALHDRWMLSRLHHTIGQVNQDLEEFMFHEAAQRLYHFFWDDFCDWYIELSKSHLSASVAGSQSIVARRRLVYVLETALRLLHPFMPFITEELWQRLPIVRSRDSICVAPFPTADAALVDEQAERQMQTIIELIKKVRAIRGELNIELGRELALLLHAPNDETRQLIQDNSEPLRRLARVNLEFVSSINQWQHVARDVVADIEMALPLEGLIDFDKESTRLSKNLAKLEKEIEQLDRRLSSSDFLQRAAADVVAATRERHHELQAQRTRLIAMLQQLTS
ncbi:MAG: valine--tRNA ligase [Acidobacteriota bacterium]|nr:valine--tRNA ligase [Blastocatellia bacterium]MDW8240743.1 valine--tRNA ligase [Acidobacteriota bacterium]